MSGELRRQKAEAVAASRRDDRREREPRLHDAAGAPACARWASRSRSYTRCNCWTGLRHPSVNRTQPPDEPSPDPASRRRPTLQHRSVRSSEHGAAVLEHEPEPAGGVHHPVVAPAEQQQVRVPPWDPRRPSARRGARRTRTGDGHIPGTGIRGPARSPRGAWPPAPPRCAAPRPAARSPVPPPPVAPRRHTPAGVRARRARDRCGRARPCRPSLRPPPHPRAPPHPP